MKGNKHLRCPICDSKFEIEVVIKNLVYLRCSNEDCKHNEEINYVYTDKYNIWILLPIGKEERQMLEQSRLGNIC